MKDDDSLTPALAFLFSLIVGLVIIYSLFFV